MIKNNILKAFGIIKVTVPKVVSSLHTQKRKPENLFHT